MCVLVFVSSGLDFSYALHDVVVYDMHFNEYLLKTINRLQTDVTYVISSFYKLLHTHPGAPRLTHLYSRSVMGWRHKSHRKTFCLQKMQSELKELKTSNGLGDVSH